MSQYRVGSPGTNALATALAATALIALVLLVAHVERSGIEARQLRVLDAQAADLDRQLAQLAVVPRLLADDPRMAAALAPDGPDASGPSGKPEEAAARERARRAADRVLERAGRDSGAAYVYLMDRSGRTVAASNWRDPLSFVGADYGFRPYFRGALAGAETTFHAVGATTGEPGYFVARPVRGAALVERPTGASGDPSGEARGPIVGVVAAKLSLDALVDAWRAQPHRSIVTDELGVVILSTDASLLYTPTRPLDAAAEAILAADRRYAPASASPLSFDAADASSGLLRGEPQRVASRALRDEPWALHLLLPERPVTPRAALVGTGIAAFALIGWLLTRVFRQQRRIAGAEQLAARELERLVARRTGELQAAQRALIAESNFAMLGRMSAAINHEINQPLASLGFDLATLHALAERDPPPLAGIREAVADLERTTRRIGRVVETLRRVARQGAGELVPLDAARLLAEALDTVRRERPDGAGAVRLASPADADREPGHGVRGNAVLLQQAVLNLVHNAIDAARDGEAAGVELRLEGSPDGRWLDLVVADAGRGVDAALAERLFEPFQTGAPGSGSGPGSGRGLGLGLGLALARQIATDHGGTLEHRPRAGGGSEFTLRLPRVDRSSTGASAVRDPSR